MKRYYMIFGILSMILFIGSIITNVILIAKFNNSHIKSKCFILERLVMDMKRIQFDNYTELIVIKENNNGTCFYSKCYFVDKRSDCNWDDRLVYESKYTEYIIVGFSISLFLFIAMIYFVLMDNIFRRKRNEYYSMG